MKSDWRIVVVFIAVLAIGLSLGTKAKPPNRFGYKPNPQGVAQFLKELPQPYFRQAGAEAMDKAQGRDTFLYRSILKAHKARTGKDWVCGKQEIGSCVAWGASHAVFCADAVSWELGEIAEPLPQPVTSVIYGGSRVEARGNNQEGFDGSRPDGGFTDGSYGAGAARWLRDWGVVYPADYPGIFDYTEAGFRGPREKEEGAYGAGGKNDNYRVDRLAKKHPVRHVVKVETWDELCAAIEAGFPCTVASGQGFASTTDEWGIAEARGSWAHQMVIWGVAHKKNGVAPDDVACIGNSWGPRWITYRGKKIDPLMPDGSFWARRSVVERMIRSDTWAIGRVEGFKWKDIHNGNWLQPAPTEATVTGDKR